MPKLTTGTPRSFLQHPELFGRPGALMWQQPTTIDQYAGLRAAEVQHHVALSIAEHLEALGELNATLEQQAGLPGGRLSKLLRGHAHLTLKDVALLEGVLGPLLGGLDYERVQISHAGLRSRFTGDR